MEIPRGGGGGPKAKSIKGKYEAKPEFPGGWGFQTKKTFHGRGIDNFWSNTMLGNRSHFHLQENIPLQNVNCAIKCLHCM